MLHIQHKLSIALSATSDMTDVFEQVLEAAFQIEGMDCGGVYLVDETSGNLDLIVHKGLPSEFVKSVSHYDVDSANAHLVMAGKPIYALHQELDTSLDKPQLCENLRAIAVIPIHYENRVIACLNVASHTLDEVPVFVRVALETITSRIGSVIVRVRAEENLRRYSERLKVLHEQVQRHADELEQRVAERTAALQEANTELESFTYSVCHDLRAPLRAIHGFANALLEDYGDTLDVVGQRFAQHLVDAAQELDTLIKDLLAYSRLTTAELQLKPVSLEWVVDEVLTQLKAEIQEKEAQVTVEKPLPEVTGTRTILEQMVANLLTNAIKFVDKGVRPQVRLWTEARDEWVRLWVEDNGIGIVKEQQERIFHVFERLHGIETYPGTGIGLCIVRKGMERMGGKIGVESEVGKGSRFWVELLRV